MNMVRSMISKKQLPKTFWPEVVNWTVHVLNRSPAMAVKNKTPEEAWSGVKPSVEDFRVLDVFPLFMCLTVKELSWMIRA